MTGGFKSRFEATGIFLFNPIRIPEEARCPSISTYSFTIPGPLSDNLENEDPIDSDAVDASENQVILQITTNIIQSTPSTQFLTRTDTLSKNNLGIVI